MPNPPIEGLYALTPEGVDAELLVDAVETALAGGRTNSLAAVPNMRLDASGTPATSTQAGASMPTLAAVGGLPSAAHGDSSPEWERLSAKLFPGKRIQAGSGIVTLTAPLRAAYGASVPVKVVSKLAQTPSLYVRTL